MTVRLGVIGLGWWARFAHLPAIAAAPGLRLTAVCDADPGRADPVRADFGVPAFTDPAELYASGLVDGVVIATPHATHHAPARAALESGVHVLVEKPMTTSAAEAWDLVATAERTGTHLSVGYTGQYSAAAVRVRQAVREGEIGELVCVNGDFSSVMMNLLTGTPTYAAPGAGGQGHSQLTHLAGALTRATGQGAEQVFAYMDHRSLPVDVVDALTFRLAGGAVGSLTATGTVPEGLPTRQRLRLYGTSGMVEHDLQYGTATVHRPDGTRVRLSPDPSRPAWGKHAPVEAFGELIAGRGPNHAPGDEAAAAVDLVEAAYRSARTGLPVTITPAFRR
ncbi:Gfo/Idh/MocA family protein [Nonomuraea spiralis]|uniref:Gfo/Idh/MocA family protein n=1 Tax=Nonomuraea spiralis TaxID=46182 RepID=A0ABV5IXH5_9ACTN|nr:Gfo/Idh/MocA family oxidoreductase [Nonomuraea spiralis]GGS82534.1 oxidoreductase [Nonomuraea spiralis]